MVWTEDGQGRFLEKQAGAMFVATALMQIMSEPTFPSRQINGLMKTALRKLDEEVSRQIEIAAGNDLYVNCEVADGKAILRIPLFFDNLPGWSKDSEQRDIIPRMVESFVGAVSRLVDAGCRDDLIAGRQSAFRKGVKKTNLLTLVAGIRQI